MNDDAFTFMMQMPPEGEPVTPAEAETRLRRALKVCGGDRKQPLMNLLAFYVQSHQPSNAKPVLDDLLSVTKAVEERAFLFRIRGQLAEQLGNYQEAAHAYKAAMGMEPCEHETWYFIHNNLGYALVQLGQLKEAEVYLRKAIRIEPRRPNAYKNWGLCCLGMGRLALAARLFVKATRVEASDSRSFKNLEELVRQHPELLSAVAGLQDDLDACRTAVHAAQSAQPDMEAIWRRQRAARQPPKG